MIATAPNTQKMFGLFELDTSGVVLYSKVNAAALPIKIPSNLIGRNFFDEVSEIENVDELRRRFRYFANGTNAAEKFSFNSKLVENSIELNVMLTKISEREFDGEKKLIIVDIRYTN